MRGYTLWLVGAGLALVVASQPVPLRAAAHAARGAKALFYSETGTTVAPKMDEKPRTRPAARAPRQAPPEVADHPWVGIAYWVEWERPGSVATRIADPTRFVFQSGDRIRLHVKTNVEGYLYLVNRGSSGQTTVLFPAAGITEHPRRVRARQEYTVPERGWIRFDDQPGEENIVFLLAQRPLTDVLDNAPVPPELSPAMEARLMNVVEYRGTKDLLVETDDRQGQQATYAGASLRPAATAPGGETLLTVQTRLQHR
jgi:Domain of unknown function (DUF4384)